MSFMSSLSWLANSVQGGLPTPCGLDQTGLLHCSYKSVLVLFTTVVELLWEILNTQIIVFGGL